jgi:hypothetical protein
MQKYFLFIAIMLCGISAYAQDGKTDKYGVVVQPVLAATPDKFGEQTQRINEDMQTGGRYEYTSPTDKQKVIKLLGQMATLLQSAGSVDTMNHDMRIQLFDDQEEVNGILKHNDSNRLVCESRAPIGSNILKTVCHTHGQLEAVARKSKDDLMEFDHSRLCNGGPPDPCAATMHVHD